MLPILRTAHRASASTTILLVLSWTVWAEFAWGQSPPPVQTAGSDRTASIRSPESATTARAAFTEALRLIDAKEHQEAEAWLTRARTLLTPQDGPRLRAGVHRGLGMVAAARGEYARARAEHGQALALFTEAGDVLYAAYSHEAMGTTAFHLNDRDAARREWRSALSAFEQAGADEGQASALYNLLFVVSRGDPEHERLLERGLTLARRTKALDLEGQLRHIQADDAFERGRYGDAWQALVEAIALLERVGPGGEGKLALALTSLGRLYRAHGHYAVALGPYQRALAIQERLGDIRGTIQTLNAIGVTYGYLHDRSAEEDHKRRALDFARRTDSARIISFQTFMLATAIVKRDPQQGVLMMESVAGAVGNDEDALYQSLAYGYRQLGRFDDAVQAADRAIAAAERDHRTEFLFQALAVRAAALDRLGRPGDALADARSALDVIDRLRSELVATDFMKRGFADQHQALFTHVIDLLERRGDHAAAFAVAERGRARAFADLVATRSAPVDGLDQAAGEGSARNDAVVAMLELVLRSNGADARTAASPVSKPVLPSTATTTPLSAGDVVRLARRMGSTVLSYWVAPQVTYIWRLEQDGTVDGTRVEIDSIRLEALARALARLRPERPGESPSRQLYDLLVRPMRSRLPTTPGALLTVLGHGPVLLVSFAALRDANGRYLIEDFALHYAPAGSILDLVSRRPNGRAGSRRYLLVADPGQGSTAEGSLRALPGARQEVLRVAGQLPASSVLVLAGTHATEAAVRRSIPDYTVLHFATHGVMDEERPLETFLALHEPRARRPRAPSPLDDGRLTASEVYALRINAEFVILSACRGGGGRVSADGLFGLVRAFIAAGSPSVMASIWDVADETAARLLPGMYRRLVSGVQPGAALRLAQLELLENLRRGRMTVQTARGPRTLGEHPALWAGFVLVGQP
jgi:CHAT domain-containing protein/tetratricopeptide (TPR) repeat protein